MNAIRKVSLILVLVLCCLLATAAAEGMSATVRVYLRRLVSGYPLEIDMNGQYTAGSGSMWFASGTHLVASAQDGEILLYGNGFTLNAGTSITFERVSTEADNYLLLAGNANQYAGDLTLTIQDGQIRPVLAIEIENYVMGVVPYEMGDSFPLEALKAQAIAARTYALARRGANQDYDVEDTTNDQVYRGRAASSPLSEQAVRETAGMVALWNGVPAVCYYTASNGGQTELGEHVWEGGSSKYAYMEQKDDPYDLENESSPVRRYVLKKNPGDDGLNAELANVLEEAVAAELGTASKPLLAQQIRIDSIESAELEAPEYPGSKVMTAVRLELKVSTRVILQTTTPEPVPVTPAPEGVEVAEAKPAEPEYVFGEFESQAESVNLILPFFGALERAMGLSINVLNNEILTLYSIDDAFVFETRRFGHGAGMSQRGAEQMARAHGKTFLEILAFYYPGLSIETIDFTVPAKTDAGELAVQPTPRPSPTPRPTLMPVSETGMQQGWYKAEVTNIDEDSSLNLRAAPSLSADIRMRLYKHQELIVESETSDGWAKVHTDVIDGYVRTDYLQAIQE